MDKNLDYSYLINRFDRIDIVDNIGNVDSVQEFYKNYTDTNNCIIETDGIVYSDTTDKKMYIKNASWAFFCFQVVFMDTLEKKYYLMIKKGTSVTECLKNENVRELLSVKYTKAYYGISINDSTCSY